MKKLYPYLSLVTVLGILLTGPAKNAEAQKPGDVVIATVERGIAILKDPDLSGMDKFMERRDKLWAAISPLFDSTETAKRALGPHWNAISGEQQDQFTRVFIDLLKNIYLSKTDSYSGEKIVFVREIVSGTKAKVRTHLYINDDKKVVVDFSMHNPSGHWLAYDIQIEGVSIINNYRSQFNSFLAKQSFEELMEDLIEKQNSL